MVSNFQILSFLFLPLLSFLILIFGGKHLKNKSHFIALPLIGVMFVNSLLFLSKAIGIKHFELKGLFEWVSTGYFFVSVGYYIDNVTCIMLVVVSLISFLVHLYSTEYMEEDPR